MEADAMSELLGIARFAFRDGEVEEFKRLSAQAMEIVRAKEPGTLQYDIYFNADETEAVVIERYRDSAALLEHGANVAEIAAQVLQLGSVEGEILGDPSPELQEKLTGPEPEVFTAWLSLRG